MTAILVILGAFPFVLGGIQNWYMTTHMDSNLPYTLIAFAVLLIWGLLAFFFNQDGAQTKRIVVCLNLIAAVDLFLIGVQELILHAYWMNLIGENRSARSGYYDCSQRLDRIYRCTARAQEEFLQDHFPDFFRCSRSYACFW